jgi:hypothetical protein
MALLHSNFECQSFSSRYISEGQWGENRLKAERAWFLTEEVRRAEPETEPLLTRWGKSGVFSGSTVLSFSNSPRARLCRVPSKNKIVAEKRCWGDPRGYVPLVAGRVMESEKGRQ